MGRTAQPLALQSLPVLTYGPLEEVKNLDCTISRLRSRELDRFCLNGLSQLGDEEKILTTISLKSILFNKYEV